MPNYPGTQNTDDNLYVGVNNLSVALTDNLSVGEVTVEVADTTGFPSVGIITIELEAIHYTGIAAGPPRFTGCTRGFDGTTATAHSIGVTVFHDIPAAHHNVLKEEIKAVSDDLRDTFGSDLNSATVPAATATDIRDRVDQIAGALDNITGAGDWKTAPDNTVNAIESDVNSLQTDKVDASGDTMSGDLAMGTNKVTGLANGTASADATNKSQLDLKVAKAGDTMSGALAMGSNKVTGLANATASGDALHFAQTHKVKQIIEGTTSTYTTVSSATYTDTTLTATITPTSTSSIILILVSQSFWRASDGTSIARITRAGAGVAEYMVGYENGGGASGAMVSMIDTDSPATTSATIYKTQVRNRVGTGTISVNGDSVFTTTNRIILIELEP